MTPSRPTYRERFFYAILRLSKSSNCGGSYFSFYKVVSLVMEDAQALGHRLGATKTRHLRSALADAVATGYVDVHPFYDQIRITPECRTFMRAIRRSLRGRTYSSIRNRHRICFVEVSARAGTMLPRSNVERLVERASTIAVRGPRVVQTAATVDSGLPARYRNCLRLSGTVFRKLFQEISRYRRSLPF